MVSPDDPRYVNLVAKAQGLRSKKERKARRPPVVRPILNTPKKREPLVIPEFLAQVARRMSDQASISLDDLEYRGQSKRLGTKSGKRKLRESHWFKVLEPKLEPISPVGEIMELWHGTPLHNTTGILVSGLRASGSGMLGPGVYLGSRKKARNYAHKMGSDWGLMLYCRVALGRVVKADEDHKRHDTIFCPQGPNNKAWGGRVRMDEWCVRDPARVSVLEIHLIPRV